MRGAGEEAEAPQRAQQRERKRRSPDTLQSARFEIPEKLKRKSNGTTWHFARHRYCRTVGCKAAVTRGECCNRLSLRLDEAIETQVNTTQANATQAAEASALQKVASRFCAEPKQAQGIRTFANMLRFLA